MAFTYIDTLVEEAWGLIPGYEKARRSLRGALIDKKGSCANHSALIGRMALQQGVPALRSILFDSFNRPSHFNSYLFVDREWVRVSTDKTLEETFIDADSRQLSPTTVEWARSSYGLLEPVSDATTPEVVAELIIPEIEMAAYKEAHTAEDYLRTARYINFLNE